MPLDTKKKISMDQSFGGVTIALNSSMPEDKATLVNNATLQKVVNVNLADMEAKMFAYMASKEQKTKLNPDPDCEALKKELGL